jgi:AAA domain
MSLSLSTLGTAFDFLSHMYANTTDEGYINIFTVEHDSGQRRTAWAPLDNLHLLGEPISEFASRGDVWFGVAPRRAQLDAGRRGGVADCVSIPGLWVDVDVASDAHKLPGLPTSYEEARLLALSYSSPPSMVVRSGYGLQVWWLFRESLAADEALDMLARWQLTWEHLADQRSLHIDNVSNIDRVMRLPGTFNWKGAEPVLVTYRANECTYEHSELLETLAALPERSLRTSSTAHLAGSRFNERVHTRELLSSVGCQLVRTDANGDEHYHFPGATNDVSCTVYAEDEHCAVWSETMAKAYGLELRTPYHSFALWTYFKYGGDYQLAHAALVASGIPDSNGSTPTAAEPVKAKPQRLVVVIADAVTGERVRWVWHSWLPLGKLTVLDGDPDVGKSTLSLDIAARITRGGAMPDGTSGVASANVVLLSAEDDMNDTIIWRLMAAGAELRRVSHIQAALDGPEEVPLTIPRDLELIEQHVIERNAALVIVDVLYEYLDEKIDSHKDSSVRRALGHVRGLAQRTGAAVLALRHFKKEGTEKAIYRGGGSIGIIGAARSGWAVAYHPDDESVRVLVSVKSNLALRPTALTYKLVAHDEYPCAYVDWRGAIEISADQLLNPSERKRTEEYEEASTVMQRTIDAIKLFLPEGRDNAMLSHELRSMVMKATNCGERTYKSAHARVIFGKGWKVRLADGTEGMMVWRPDDGDADG